MVRELNSISGEEVEFSTFYVGNALCGIDILKVQEINKQFDITMVPHSEEFVEGILNLRGRIVTIINLGKKLGLNPAKISKTNRNIIVDSKEEHIGLLVDCIDDIIQAKSGEVEPAPSNLNGVNGKYFKGVLKTKEHLVGIINIDEVLKEG